MPKIITTLSKDHDNLKMVFNLSFSTKNNNTFVIQFKALQNKSTVIFLVFTFNFHSKTELH